MVDGTRQEDAKDTDRYQVSKMQKKIMEEIYKINAKISAIEVDLYTNLNIFITLEYRVQSFEMFCTCEQVLAADTAVLLWQSPSSQTAITISVYCSG